ncbi:MAG: hypothetical protein IT423_05390 [Pirellulaceae bacterium]|nr:hypothetical protein [Pirellulaceae bacterium]
MKCPIKATTRAVILACLTATVSGCVAPGTPVTTVWQKLGIPQTGARLRDSALNRRGNFPGLEKKPPLLKLADPANLAADKPAVVQTAAKIKAEQDMKKQKIKAIKFLGDVNCGCYNKDKAVEKAFIAALEDCDPDVRMAAVEAIDKTISNCSQCRAQCEATCCTEDLYKKLNDIAYGVEDGCHKEPEQDIRCAAAAVMKKCGCFKPNPIEELPTPEADEPEELNMPDEEEKASEGKGAVPPKAPRKSEGEGAEEIGTSALRYHLSDDQDQFAYGEVETPEVVVAQPAKFRMSDKGELRTVSAEKRPEPKATQPKATQPKATQTKATDSQEPRKLDRIINPERLITAKVVEYRGSLGELLVELPDSFQLNTGWTMVVVDATGHQSFARISECGGRRLLLALDDLSTLATSRSQPLKLGLVEKN